MTLSIDLSLPRPAFLSDVTSLRSLSSRKKKKGASSVRNSVSSSNPPSITKIRAGSPVGLRSTMSGILSSRASSKLNETQALHLGGKNVGESHYTERAASTPDVTIQKGVSQKQNQRVPSQPQSHLRPPSSDPQGPNRKQSKSIIKRLSTTFRNNKTTSPSPSPSSPINPSQSHARRPSKSDVPNPLVSQQAKNAREAALRARGLLPALPSQERDLSALEREQDRRLTVVLPAPDTAATGNGVSAADLIKKQWENREREETERMNILLEQKQKEDEERRRKEAERVEEVSGEREDLKRMRSFRFGGSSSPTTPTSEPAKNPIENAANSAAASIGASSNDGPGGSGSNGDSPITAGVGSEPQTSTVESGILESSEPALAPERDHDQENASGPLVYEPVLETLEEVDSPLPSPAVSRLPSQQGQGDEQIQPILVVSTSADLGAAGTLLATTANALKTKTSSNSLRERALSTSPPKAPPVGPLPPLPQSAPASTPSFPASISNPSSSPFVSSPLLSTSWGKDNDSESDGSRPNSKPSSPAFSPLSLISPSPSSDSRLGALAESEQNQSRKQGQNRGLQLRLDSEDPEPWLRYPLPPSPAPLSGDFEGRKSQSPSSSPVSTWTSGLQTLRAPGPQTPTFVRSGFDFALGLGSKSGMSAGVQGQDVVVVQGPEPEDEDVPPVVASPISLTFPSSSHTPPASPLYNASYTAAEDGSLAPPRPRSQSRSNSKSNSRSRSRSRSPSREDDELSLPTTPDLDHNHDTASMLSTLESALHSGSSNGHGLGLGSSISRNMHGIPVIVESPEDAQGSRIALIDSEDAVVLKEKSAMPVQMGVEVEEVDAVDDVVVPVPPVGIVGLVSAPLTLDTVPEDSTLITTSPVSVSAPNPITADAAHLGVHVDSVVAASALCSDTSINAVEDTITSATRSATTDNTNITSSTSAPTPITRPNRSTTVDDTKKSERRKSLSLFGRRKSTIDPVSTSNSSTNESGKTSALSQLRRSVVGTLTSKSKRSKSPASPLMATPGGKGRFDASHLPPSPSLPEALRAQQQSQRQDGEMSPRQATFSDSEAADASVDHDGDGDFGPQTTGEIQRGRTLTVRGGGDGQPKISSLSSQIKTTGVGLRNRSSTYASSNSQGSGSPRVAVDPTMHSRGSILFQTNGIEDEESRRVTEVAFLY